MKIACQAALYAYQLDGHHSIDMNYYIVRVWKT